MIRFFKNKVKYLISPKYAYLKRFDAGCGDVVVDLGANVGEVSEYFCAKGAKVYAYEPNPHAFDVLSRRLGQKSNVFLHKAAVSNFTGSSKLWLHENHKDSEVGFSQSGSLQAEKENVSDDSVEVDVLNIKGVLDQHESIKILKIDIEGGEYDIMDEVLSQCHKIDHVLLETHEKKSPIFQEKNEFLLKNIRASGFAEKIHTDWF